jgi:hypothetical protein
MFNDLFTILAGKRLPTSETTTSETATSETATAKAEAAPSELLAC